MSTNLKNLFFKVFLLYDYVLFYVFILRAVFCWYLCAYLVAFYIGTYVHLY